MVDCGLRIRVRVSGPIFDTLFMVRVRVRVISGYDVTLNMSTAVRIKLQSEKWQFTPTYNQDLLHAGHLWNPCYL